MHQRQSISWNAWDIRCQTIQKVQLNTVYFDFFTFWINKQQFLTLFSIENIKDIRCQTNQKVQLNTVYFDFFAFWINKQPF